MDHQAVGERQNTGDEEMVNLFSDEVEEAPPKEVPEEVPENRHVQEPNVEEAKEPRGGHQTKEVPSVTPFHYDDNDIDFFAAIQ